MHLRTTLPLLAAVSLLASPAVAQFRPPPMSEGQRLAVQGDDARAEASERLKTGDKKGAQEKNREALALYEQALQLEPDRASAAIGLGAAGNAVGEHDKVVAKLTPFAAANEGVADVHFHLGVALYKTKKYPEAAASLEKISAQLDASHLIAHFYLANYYVAIKRGEQAVIEVQRYLQLRPPALAGNDSEILLLLGRAHLIAQQPAEARAAFKKSEALKGETLNSQLGFAAVLEAEGKPTEAIALLERLVARAPKSPDAKERLANLLLETGNADRAELIGKQLLALSQTADTQLLYGRIKLAQKDAPAAEKALQEALKLKPGYPAAQIRLATAVQMQGRNDEAITLLEQAVASGESSVEVLGALGSTYRRAGRFQKAIELHQKVLAQTPGQPLGHMLLGADHFVSGQFELAIDDYTAAVAVAPNDPKARHWLALALNHRARQRADGKRFDDAIRDLRRAFDLEYTAPMGRNLATVLLAQNQFEQAREVLDKSTKLAGANWRDHQLLGYARLGAGDPGGAVIAFESAARLTTETGPLSEIYAGWALSKLEVGEFEAAMAKLNDPSMTAAAAKVTQANLPLALLKRALARVGGGDAAGAAQDLESYEKLPRVKNPDIDHLANLTRALSQVESGSAPRSAAALQKALSAKTRWSTPATRPLVEGYIAYRRGSTAPARRLLAAAAKKTTPEQAEWVGGLSRAIDRREGELAFARGSMPQAQKALKSALAADPLNPVVLHNMASVDYKLGRVPAAIAAWKTTADAVPEAHLNLGIYLQTKQRDARGAVEAYARYLATNPSRAAQVRDWKERLQVLYGLSEPTAAAEVTE